MATKKDTPKTKGKPATGRTGTRKKSVKPSPDQQAGEGLPGDDQGKPHDQAEFDRIREMHNNTDNAAVLGLTGKPEDMITNEEGLEAEPGTMITEKVKAFAEEHGLPEDEAFEIMKSQGLLDGLTEGTGNDDETIDALTEKLGNMSAAEINDLVNRTRSGELTDTEILQHYKNPGLTDAEIINQYREKFNPVKEAGKPAEEIPAPQQEAGKPSNKKTFTFTADDEEAEYIEKVIAARMKQGMCNSKNHCLRQIVNVGINTEFDYQLNRVTDNTLMLWNPVEKNYLKNV